MDNAEKEVKSTIEERPTSCDSFNKLKIEHENMKMDHLKCSDDTVVDFCAENKICSSKVRETTDSKTSLHSCSCGPECAPGICDRGKQTSLVSWDEMRTKTFICLLIAFLIWALIYIFLSLSVL